MKTDAILSLGKDLWLHAQLVDAPDGASLRILPPTDSGLASEFRSLDERTRENVEYYLRGALSVQVGWLSEVEISLAPAPNYAVREAEQVSRKELHRNWAFCAIAAVLLSSWMACSCDHSQALQDARATAGYSAGCGQ